MLTQNTFEGATPGTDITAANSGVGGSAFDSISTVAGTTLKYDNAHAAHGTVAMFASSGTTASSPNVRWSSTIGTLGTLWFRVYIYVTGYPAAQVRIFEMRSGSSVVAGTIRLNPSGTIAAGGASGVVVTTTATVPLNQWVRIEGKIIGSSTAGQVEVVLYSSFDSTTPTETQTSASTLNTTGMLNEVRMGLPGTNTSGDPGIWMDDVAVSDTAYIGPVQQTVAISSTMTVSTQATRSVSIAASLLGTMTVTAGSTAKVSAAAVLQGRMTVTASPTVVTKTAALIASSMIVTTTAQNTYLTSVFIVSTMTVTATAAVPSFAAANITASLVIVADSTRQVAAAVSIINAFTVAVGRLVNYAFTTSRALANLRVVTTVHGTGISSSEVPNTRLIAVKVVRTTQANSSGYFVGHPRVIAARQNSNSAYPAIAHPTLTFNGILTRIRILSGIGGAYSSLDEDMLNRIVVVLQPPLVGESAAGEKPPRIVITTSEVEAVATLIGDVAVRSIHGYAEGSSKMIGNLINGAHYTIAVARTSMTGRLVPVVHMQQALRADAQVAGKLHAAVFMTNIVSYAPIVPPHDDESEHLMGVHVHDTPLDVSYAARLPQDVTYAIDDSSNDAPNRFNRTFTVMPK